MQEVCYIYLVFIYEYSVIISSIDYSNKGVSVEMLLVCYLGFTKKQKQKQIKTQFMTADYLLLSPDDSKICGIGHSGD